MFVIKRVGKDYGQFSITHLNLEDAEKEAERLATKHAAEEPIFVIYELLKRETVSAKVVTTKELETWK